MIFKGERGYLKYRKIRLGIISLIGFVIMLGLFVTGYVIWQTPRNYVTILAVVIVLPTAKFFVQYLMLPWKCNATEEEFNRISAICAPLRLYCELLITAQEKSFEILYMVIDKDDNIVAYTPKLKAEAVKFEKGIANFLNYYEFDSKVKLFTDLKSFEKRIKQLAAKNTELTEENAEHIASLFEKLSIMCI